MAGTLSTLSIISFIISGVGIGLAIFFGIIFKIPTVISDLSGRTARKSIAQMREANEKSGAKAHKASKENASRGKVTATIPNLKGTKKKKTETDERPETGLLTENKAVGFESEETGLLSAQETVLLSQETALLGTEETACLIPEETALFVDEKNTANVTAPLSKPMKKKEKRNSGRKVKIIEEVMLIHTHEVIEE